MAGELCRQERVLAHGRGSQRGATLMEIVVVIAVAVPVILAAAAGLLMTVRLSSGTAQQQQAEAQATAYAESVKQITYVPCAEVADYDGAPGLWSPPAGVEVEVAAVRYWDQTDRDYTATTCSAPDQGSQLVTVRAVTRERSTTLDVVKRNPDASAEQGSP